MGIDGFWIGYEGTRSNYAKQQGRPVADIFTEFREHGITILTSMIVGFDYQNQEVVAKELDGLMQLKPALAQFLIYGPVPGTPFYERIIKDNLLQDVYTDDKDLFYRRADGFRTMIKHPTLSAEEIEAIQEWCFKEDFQRLGPSIYRVLEARLLGLQKLKNSPNPLLRAKAEYYAGELRYAYPVFLAGRLLGPNAAVRRWIGDLERRIHAELGAPRLRPAAQIRPGRGGGVVDGADFEAGPFSASEIDPDHLSGARAGAGARLKCGRNSSARPPRRIFPSKSSCATAKEEVWMRLEGVLSPSDAEALGDRIQESLAAARANSCSTSKNFAGTRWRICEPLREKLAAYRSRIRVVLPKLSLAHPELILLAAMFQAAVNH